MYKVLFIDDEFEKWMTHLKGGLSSHGFEVIGEDFPEKGVFALLKEHTPDVVLLDIWDKGENKGKPILAQIKEKSPDLPVVMFTTTLIDAPMIDPEDYTGAFYSFAKQELNPDKDKDPYKGLAEQLEMAIADVSTSKKSLDERLGFIVGNTPKMQGVAKHILQVAPTDTTVLITGETGTGKELVARAIHKLSSRHNQHFEAVHCGALTETLLETELFGHEKGAFTGANRQHIGIFERASGGTVFLDEIETMSQSLQVKLLRVLSEKMIKRVGGKTDITIDVRLISATNQDLNEKIRNDTFRDDLYYRLKVVEITLPPLCERISDIPIFYAHFVTQFNKRHNKQVSTKLNDNVLKKLQNYNWPGNIGQLENVIEAAIVKARSNVLTPSAFNLESDSPDESVLPINVNEAVSNLSDGRISWDALKNIHGDSRKKILQALIERMKEKNNGKRPKSSELAKILNVSEAHMRQILRNVGIKLRNFR